jgi:magnesium chelatase family protein
LERAAARFQLSARGIARALRVARTIADLSASPIVAHEHLAEALQFRTEADA